MYSTCGVRIRILTRSDGIGEMADEKFSGQGEDGETVVRMVTAKYSIYKLK